jgi:hypothetical protein
MKFLILLAPTLLLVSCTGYHLGETKPRSLARVKTIAVPMFSNSTLFPRAEAVATSAVAEAIVQDGTYQIVTSDKADAILQGNVKSIKYKNLRGNRNDVFRPENLGNTVSIDWQLHDAKDPTKVLASGKSEGRSEFFVAPNLQTARNNALPDAFQRAGVALVSRLADGY